MSEIYKGMKYTIRSDGRCAKKVTINNKPIYLCEDEVSVLYSKYIDLQYKKQNQEIIKPTTYTVSQYSDIWYENYVKPTKLDNETKRMYEDCIRLYIKPAIGKIKLNKLTELDVTKMINWMTEKGITRRREVALLTLKQILKKAIANDLLRKNVADEVKIIKHVPKEQKPLSNQIIELILELPNELDPSVLMMKFIMTTGTRPEEVSPLEKDDILDTQKVDINKVVDLESKDLKIDYYTKNKDTRQIPLITFIYNDLVEHISKSNNKLLFPNTRGTLKSRYSFRRDLERFLRILNKYYEEKIKQMNPDFQLTDENKISFTLYQLRHTYACILHKAGVPLKEAQSFMGHKDLKVLLNIYTHIDEEDVENASNELNKYVYNKFINKSNKNLPTFLPTFCIEK